jgi:PAS domain S-box-containing protein
MTEPMRILIVEDNPADAELVERQLRREVLAILTRRVEARDEFLRALGEFAPDLVISDYSMPQFNGMEALRLTQEHASHVPVIIVTGSLNEETAVDCMKAGAADYILKDRTARLVHAVRSALESSRIRRERDRAEAALRLDAAILHNLSEGVALVSREDRTILVANPRYEKMLGYRPGELVGKSVTISEPPSPSSPNEIATKIERDLDETGEWHGELENIREDGSRFWSQTNISLFDHHELGRLAIAIHTDISERRLAEEKLEYKRAELQSIYDNSPVMMCVLDAERRVLFANRAFAVFVNVSEPDLHIGRAGDVLGCINAQDDPRGCSFGESCQGCALRSAIEESFRTERGLQDVERTFMLERDGVRRDVVLLASTAPIPADDGPRLLLCLQDITERTRAEAALRESETRFSTIFHASPMCIAITRLADGSLLDVNEAWEETTGVSHGDAIGHSPVVLGLWMEPAERERMLAALQSGSPVRGLDVRLRDRLGQRHDMLMSAEAIELRGELCMLSIAAEITERKQTEALLAEQLEELRRWHDVTVGREGRVIELKKEVNELLEKAGQPPRYQGGLEKED